MAFSQVGMPKGSKGCILTIIIHPVKAEGRTQEVMCSCFCCCYGGCGICIPKMGFLGGSVLKNLPANAGDVGDAGSILRSLGQDDPLEEEMATHSSVFA